MKIFLSAKHTHPRIDEIRQFLMYLGYQVYSSKNLERASEKEDYRKEDRKFFDRDMNALRKSDVVVALLPGGRGMCVEIGYAAASGKLVYLLFEDKPELMFGVTTDSFRTKEELAETLYEVNKCLTIS